MGLGTLALVAAQGFAEATVFFVVADVAVSWIALHQGIHAGLCAALAAAVGSLVGIALLYGWAEQDATTALALVDGVPSVTSALITEMRGDLAAKGLIAVLEAGATGMPIKIAAVLAPEFGIGAAAFLFLGFIQRLACFALVALLAGGIATSLRRDWSERTRLALWAGFWLLFYALYWTAVI